ncbi:MAG TPA: hypothetical protein VM263_05650, partial [Acidimicrobiales bacterium]|nr:hypothetical protein [Acidimicrobiales bacterium]
PSEGIELVPATDEDEYFPPPRELRDLQRAAVAAAGAPGASSAAPAEPPDDRSVPASAVLDQLAGLQPAPFR